VEWGKSAKEGPSLCTFHRSGSIGSSLDSENIARNEVMQCINYLTDGLADMSFRTTHIVAIFLGSLLFTFVAIAVAIIIR